MTHLWIRAEQRAHEKRTGVTPEGAAALLADGFAVTVEDSPDRVIPTDRYAAAGCAIAPAHSWPDAPAGAIVFGLKELPDNAMALRHRHIMFGHAYKGQQAGGRLLERFRAGGGALYDLEYLTDDDGRRVAAFGYWAGFAGAAVTLKCWIAQQHGGIAGPVTDYHSSEALLEELSRDLAATAARLPDALVVGALGRVGTGAIDLCRTMSIRVTGWDMAETAHGGPFPEILNHAIFLNAILAGPGCPVFVPASARPAPRRLRAIGDIACDPDSDFNPVQVYDRATTWTAPALRVHDDPPLDVMAIDNLPSLLPLESSLDFAEQLLPWLKTLDRVDAGIWARARAEFDRHSADL